MPRAAFAVLGSICFGYMLFAAPQTAYGEAMADDLFAELAHMDSVLFDHAFNRRDPEAMHDFFTEDLEFYHDKDGVVCTSREQFVDGLRRSLDERFVDGKPRTRREVLAESLEVFPMNGYGAIQTGVHRFHNLQEDGSYKLEGVARFTHLWRKGEDGRWRIARVLSYDHGPAK